MTKRLLQLVALVLCLLVATPGGAGTPASLHALLVALPAFAREPVPETAEDRAERLEVVAQAIEKATTDRMLRAMVMELGRAETHYALYVHSGNCEAGPKGMRCDGGKAKGPWQQHKYGCAVRVWELEDGSVEQIETSARCAAHILSREFKRCKSRNPDPIAGAFSGYRGASCTEAWANGRANRARVLAARLGG